MIIFKDKLTDNEFFTDSSKYSIINDCLYDVKVHLETRKEGEVVLAGSNPSAEEANEDFDENVKSGLDVVLNHNLVETSFPEKNAFKVYMKDYSKKLQAHLTDNGATPDEITTYKKRMQDAFKFLLEKFKDLQFFLGESSDPDATVASVLYHDDGTVSMYLFLAGITEEKV